MVHDAQVLCVVLCTVIAIGPSRVRPGSHRKIVKITG